MKRRIYLAVAMAAACATPALAQGMHGQAYRGMRGPAQMAGQMAPQQYIAQAGASDLYERRASEMMLGSSRDPRVRQFASKMVRDHSHSTMMVKRAAMQARMMVPPPQLMPDQQRMLDELRMARGPQKDRLYWQQQRMAHQQALALHSDFARAGGPPPLRNAASMIVPVVEQHIAMLRNMR